jgi:hypothetical protein
MESVAVGRDVSDRIAKENNIAKFNRISLDTGTFLAHDGVVDEIVADEQGRFYLESVEINRATRMIRWLQADKIRDVGKRNTSRRAKNAVLRELCGTSARVARADMGL